MESCGGGAHAGWLPRGHCGCSSRRCTSSPPLCAGVNPLLYPTLMHRSFARNVDVETSPDADTPRPCGVALLVRGQLLLPGCLDACTEPCAADGYQILVPCCCPPVVCQNSG